MLVALAITGVAFAALCVWLTVRIVNRKERWAKWMLASVLGLPVLYVASFGPACWITSRTGVGATAIPLAYLPIIKTFRSDNESAIGHVLWQFAKLGAADDWEWVGIVRRDPSDAELDWEWVDFPEKIRAVTLAGKNSFKALPGGTDSPGRDSDEGPGPGRIVGTMVSPTVSEESKSPEWKVLDAFGQKLNERSAEFDVKGFDVSFTLADGILTLRGHVPSPEVRRKVLEIARALDGVRAVQDFLEMNAPQ